MRLNGIVSFCLLASASAFAPAGGRTTTSSLKMQERSKALPFDSCPKNLDGTLPGDVGFDPAGFTNNPPKSRWLTGEGPSLKWYREAEIVHGRVAQLAVLGNLVPGWFHWSVPAGFPGIAPNAFAELNPFKTLDTIPEAGLWQIVCAIYVVELYRAKNVLYGDAEPGDLGLGQTGWNPFGFKYTEEEYFEKQVQEIKHGRLAMFGAVGMLLQAKFSGMGIVEQLGGAFSYPDERYKIIFCAATCLSIN